MNKIKSILIFVLLITTLQASKNIIINLSTQKIYAKENGNILFQGSISSGTSKHRTPTGNFKVLEKDRFHVSDKYPEPKGGAKMHYMLRLTNKGIAIHKGYLPGYPASHGCIRVSKTTALKLWRWARVGTRVKIIGNASNFRYTKKKKRKTYYSKKHSTRKKHYKKRYKKTKKYVKNNTRYRVVELYDDY